MKIIIVIFAILCLSAALKPKTFPKYAEQAEMLDESSLTYQTLYYDQKISHFNYKYSGKTYKQKYLIDTINFDKNSKGAILMYCGN
jgi:hypothetical protein